MINKHAPAGIAIACAHHPKRCQAKEHNADDFDIQSSLCFHLLKLSMYTQDTSTHHDTNAEDFNIQSSISFRLLKFSMYTQDTSTHHYTNPVAAHPQGTASVTLLFCPALQATEAGLPLQTVCHHHSLLFIKFMIIEGAILVHLTQLDLVKAQRDLGVLLDLCTTYPTLLGHPLQASILMLIGQSTFLLPGSVFPFTDFWPGI